MKSIRIILTSIILLIFAVTGCSNNQSYSPNKNSPSNVRESFYEKSVEVMNFYIKKIESRSVYHNDDNEYLLEYYRSTPSNSSEEVMIKTSLTYLDLIYKNYENSLKNDDGDQIESDLIDFQNQLKEVLELLEIEER